MPERASKRTVFGRAGRWAGYTLGAFVLASLLMVVPLRWIDPPTTAFMLADASGVEPLRHEWVDLEAISPSAALAVVAAEDQRFADHIGFDIDAIRDSIAESEDSGRPRGASTISQQVVKNLYLWSGRSYLRKGVEAWLTLLVELAWPKRRILEIYLNVAEFGPGTYGVGAASRHYFGKPPEALTAAEAGLLAAVLPSPKRLSVAAPSAYVRERQRWILNQMERLRRESWLTRIE